MMMTLRPRIPLTPPGEGGMDSPFGATLRAVLDAGHQARFVARGDSMYPTIQDGETLRVARCRTDTLQVGDIVIASLPRGLTSHRVIRIRQARDGVQVVTRGDNSFRSDPPFAAGQLVGRVVEIEEAAGRSRLARHPALFRLSRRIASRLRLIIPHFP
jgi:signal peptidase I